MRRECRSLWREAVRWGRLPPDERGVGVFRGRGSLAWLLVVPVLYVGALPLVNRVEPVVFGLPFLAVWLFGATLLTPVAVWLAARGDPVWRSGGAGPVASGDVAVPGRDPGEDHR